MLVPVILAGGSGTRLWPLSREAHPKQFIPAGKQLSLFQQTLARVASLKHAQSPIVVGNEQHRFLMAEQIRQSAQAEALLLLEPCFKGTAPAVALATMQSVNYYDQDVFILVLPADHVIHDLLGFQKSVEQAQQIAAQGKLVTFGITPTHPEVGYGYIQKGAALGLAALSGHEIARFVEKPNVATAQHYCESQDYYWNSGMFLFSAATFLQELLLHAPEIYHASKLALTQATVDRDFIRPAKVYFDQIPTDSIDYAVMEKTHQGAVVPLQSDWSDVGSWDAWLKLFPADLQGNVALGDVQLQGSQNCFVHAAQRLVVALGVKDLVIVETPDAVLVLEKTQAQQVKTLVSQLNTQSRKETRFHRRVSRPWGAFESIDAGDRFQVKRLMVAVGQKLSLQRHHHRSEHWVVVKGTARVSRGSEVFLLSENQSTYIPIGVNHRLENVGKIPLEIIEVQSGAYLGEDDIVRLEDHYGRDQENQSDLAPLSVAPA